MPNPNLEQQRKRAKDLLRAHRQGDAEAVRRVGAHLPRASRLLPAQVRRLPLKLSDAQLVIAREAGLPTWPRLKRAALQATGDRSLEAAVETGDVAAVRAALASGPERWVAREALEVAVERDDRETARLLLAYGAWPDHAGRRRGRQGGCLHAALLFGRGAELVEVLLAGGASVSARDRDGRTPLAIAVRTGQTDAAELLRAHGASDSDITEIDGVLGGCVRGEGPTRARARLVRSDHQHLCWAVRTGHHEALPALLALGLDPDVPDDDGETALHLAVAAGSLPALEALLAASPRVDAPNYRNETPLTCAMREPDARLREALLAAGARPQDQPDLAEELEAAADAVVAGDVDRLTALLDREPRLVTARSLRDHRSTLLHYVAANGVEQERQRSPQNAGAVAELLLRRGADPDALAFTYGGGPGQTTLNLAVTSVHPEEAGVTGDIVAALARGGAKVNGLDEDRTPLKEARRSAWPALLAAGANVDLVSAAALGRADEVKRFISAEGVLAPGATIGPDVSFPDQRVKDRAFIEACASGHTEIADYLLRAGARIEAKGGEGMTGLHHAAWHCHLPTVRLLLARGAPTEAVNDYGGTVLDFVVWVIRNQWKDGRDYAALVETLVAAGADLNAVEGVPTGRAEVDAVFRRRGKTTS